MQRSYIEPLPYQWLFENDLFIIIYRKILNNRYRKTLVLDGVKGIYRLKRLNRKLSIVFIRPFIPVFDLGIFVTRFWVHNSIKGLTLFYRYHKILQQLITFGFFWHFQSQLTPWFFWKRQNCLGVIKRFNFFLTLFYSIINT